MEKHRNWQQGSSIHEEVFDKSCAVKKGNKKSQIQYNVAFENVPFHEEASEIRSFMFPEIVCVSLITQQILTAIIPLFHFSHHHHPGGLLESLEWMCAQLSMRLSSA